MVIMVTGDGVMRVKCWELVLMLYIGGLRNE